MQNLFISDLHGNKKKISSLFDHIKETLPDAVFFGGDLLPNSYSLKESMDEFINEIYLRPISSIKNQKPSIRFFFILGNDDPKTYESIFLTADEEDLIDYVHMKTVSYQNYFVTGYACIPPTPFQLKDWERYDVSRFLDLGVIPPEEGIHSVIFDPDEIKYGTIKEDLEKLIQNAQPQKTIFLFHSPPYNTHLDRADLDGKYVDHAPVDVHIGSIAIREFITTYQPAITLHGHVHESVKLTGQWMQRFDRTYSFSAAESSDVLSIVTFDPGEPEKTKRITFPV